MLAGQKCSNGLRHTNAARTATSKNPHSALRHRDRPCLQSPSPQSERWATNAVPAHQYLLACFTRAMISALALTTVSAGSVLAAPIAYREPVGTATFSKIRSQFGTLMERANRHDLKTLHELFWQSPSALLVAKSPIPSVGNCHSHRMIRPSVRCFCTIKDSSGTIDLLQNKSVTFLERRRH